MKWALLGLVAFALLTVGLATWREARFRAAFPPLGQFVTVDGLQVHYVIAGSGPDLVLIHGSSGNLRDFTFKLVPLLAEKYRVIAFDRPGLGYSDALPDGSIFAQAEHLAKAARELGIERPILVGHSYGGPVAIAWALAHPEETSALVTLAAPVRPWESGLGTLYTVTSNPVGSALIVPMLTAYVPVSVARRALAALFPNGNVPEGLLSYYGAELSLQRNVMRENARQRATLLSEVIELSADYDKIDIAWELVHGTADDVVYADFHTPWIAERAPSVAITLLPGTGHMVELEDPEAVIAAIDRAAGRAALP